MEKANSAPFSQKESFCLICVIIASARIFSRVTVSVDRQTLSITRSVRDKAEIFVWRCVLLHDQPWVFGPLLKYVRYEIWVNTSRRHGEPRAPCVPSLKILFYFKRRQSPSPSLQSALIEEPTGGSSGSDYPRPNHIRTAYQPIFDAPRKRLRLPCPMSRYVTPKNEICSMQKLEIIYIN